MKHMSKLFLFLDYETTGLDPEYDKIVEVAATITDHLFNPIIVGNPHFDRVIHQPRAVWDSANEWCQNTHSDSGLIEESIKRGCSPELVERDLNDFVRAAMPYGVRRMMLAGNSVHFDKDFMKVHHPFLLDRLQYRLFDVSAHLRTFQHFGIPIVPPPPPDQHRARADINWTMDGARSIRDLLCTAAPVINYMGENK